MKVFNALRQTRITQGWGENKACVQTQMNGQPYRPYRVRSTQEICPVGYKKFYSILGLNGHNGVDYAAWHGAPIYFPVDANTEWYAHNEKDADGGLGLDVISKSPIKLNDTLNVYVKFRFWHLLESAVADLEPVKFGQHIARADSTGASSGDHLHMAMKFVDENGSTINNGNGYAGCVDFSPWYEPTFVLDVLAVKQQAARAIDLAHMIIAQVRRYLASIMK